MKNILLAILTTAVFWLAVVGTARADQANPAAQVDRVHAEIGELLRLPNPPPAIRYVWNTWGLGNDWVNARTYTPVDPKTYRKILLDVFRQDQKRYVRTAQQSKPGSDNAVLCQRMTQLLDEFIYWATLENS
jgi:hypothetical protein